MHEYTQWPCLRVSFGWSHEIFTTSCFLFWWLWLTSPRDISDACCVTHCLLISLSHPLSVSLQLTTTRLWHFSDSRTSLTCYRSDSQAWAETTHWGSCSSTWRPLSTMRHHLSLQIPRIQIPNSIGPLAADPWVCGFKSEEGTEWNNVCGTEFRRWFLRWKRSELLRKMMINLKVLH